MLGSPRQSCILNSTLVDSALQLLDSGFQSSVASGFLELCSGVQSPAFWIPWEKMFWIPDSMRKTSRIPDSLQLGDRGKQMFVTPATQRAKTKAEIK